MLSLNQATMRAAVQMYLDAQRREDAPPTKVLSVAERRNDDGFDVELTSPVPNEGA